MAARPPALPLLLAALAGRAALAALAAADLDCGEEECPRPRGAAMLQKSFGHRDLAGLEEGREGAQAVIASEEEEDEGAGAKRPGGRLMGPAGRSRAEDARFLMQATFGPTPESLSELQGKSYQQWFREQMDVPMELHREFYRERVNPAYLEGLGDRQVARSTPCSQGRYQGFAFNIKDDRSWDRARIQIGRSDVKVDGKFRTLRKRGDWSIGAFNGYICAVVEGVGREIHVSQYKSCHYHLRKVLKNPEFYVRGAVRIRGDFKTVKPGVMILEKTHGRCKLQRPADGKDLFIEVDGKHYWYDDRFRALRNSPGQPSTEYQYCARMDAVNEGRCKIGPVVGGQRRQGLLVEVHDAYYYGRYWEEQPPVPVAAIFDPNIDHPAKMGSFWPEDYPHLGRRLTYRWTGILNIHKAGDYQFFLASDDGSRLYLDGELVVSNDGYHPFREQKGAFELSRGRHDLLVDAFQAGGGQGIVLAWQGPDSGNRREVVPNKAFYTHDRMMDPSSCPISCGSVGEVASKPELGHQMAMYLHTHVAFRDKRYDNRYVHRIGHEHSKTTVWTMKTLYGKDQLRQRMAWALSQILVTSTQGVGHGNWAEMWTRYYDIFVRHAFGNFYDVLKEVTFSPTMGLYLTHVDSSSYDHNGAFPNENYAREIMQLFTIGLDMLNSDGSLQRDSKGGVIPTYTNDGILSLSRVFSGFAQQPPRRNVEHNHGKNYQDPMRLWVETHDIYPKPDLTGGYIGDGFPLCSVDLPKHSYLSKGAKYVFMGLHAVGKSLSLQWNSRLGTAICPGNKCESATVVLADNLRCTGSECETDSVELVKFRDMYFRYVPPPCVHLQMPPATEKETDHKLLVTKGQCVVESGHRPQYEIRLDSGNSHGLAREQECLAKCRARGATGCKLAWHRGDHGCFVEHDLRPYRGDGTSRNVKCWHFGDTGKKGESYMLLGKQVDACPPGTRVTSLAECDAAVRSLGHPILGTPYVKWKASQNIPGGCSYHKRGKHILWNGLESVELGHKDHTAVCRAHIVIAEDGAVVQTNGVTSFSAPWLSPRPAAGVHPVSVETRRVFNDVPTKNEALQKLTVGAHPPAEPCCVCQGAVKAYPDARGICHGAVAAYSVFEIDGKFYQNVESVLKFDNGKEAFRNPPVFLKSNIDRWAQEQMQAEVEATLRHLVHHPNCPVFVAKRLIARYGNSNPTPQYVEAVQRAFREGRYGGVIYSGLHGDLAATLAAILLHPEAREEEQNAETSVRGALREPLLKVMHLLRSMEYKDADGQNVVLEQLHDMIGQFPFKSPTVFNYYVAGFELPQVGRIAKSTETVLAPEFQIFTPPYFIGYLNGMHSLVDMGVTGWCRTGLMGVGAYTYANGRNVQICPQGRLEYKGSGDKAKTLEDLDVMLTGGRLSPKAKEVVSTAYDRAPEGKSLQEAQKALVMTAEFNTLGASLPQSGTRPVYKEPESGNPRPYKAVVLLFFGGGADTWNMLVPQNCDQYEDYRKMRTDLTLEPRELLKISTGGQRCRDFGIHASMPFLKSLYDSKEAAFLTNIGNLVEPTTLADFRSNRAQKCFNLFSHYDQANGAMTLKCQQNGASAHGSGGRLGDALANGRHKFRTTSYSMSGSAVWSMGAQTQREIVNGGGAVVFRGYDEWNGAIQNITAQHHGNVYAEVFSESFRTTVAQSRKMEKVLGETKLATSHRWWGGLEMQFQQVAKLIAARQGRTAERDFFFVQTNGFDMHQNMKKGLQQALAYVDKSIRVFVEELKAQKIWDSVLLTTESEFARTLSSNGGGSDHGWAGQHFVAGGAVKGGRIFNQYPSSLTASPQDLGRGRLIPEYPWESIVVPVAEWLGVEKGQYGQVFPNLGNFNSSHLIPRREIFK